MIHPAPTSKVDPTLLRGTLEQVIPASATKPAHVVLGFANTSYQTHLIPTVDPSTLAERVGKRVIGRINLQARRVDIVESGGRYLEPVYGRPRRVQGAVVATDIPANMIVLDAGTGGGIHCQLTDSRQSAREFAIGDFVSFDAMDGATFTPVEA